MLPNMRVDNNKGVGTTSWFIDGLSRVLPWANTLNKTAESSSNELSKGFAIVENGGVLYGADLGRNAK